MNFAAIIKAFDALMLVGEAARRLTQDTKADAEVGLSESASDQAPAGPLEARLGNLVVAALKEAFDRDHTRLEMERVHLEEERRRAERALRAELRRQAIDRELGRLRLLAGTALVGWMASVAMLAFRLDAATTASRAVVAIGWLLLLGSLASAFGAQRRLSAMEVDAGEDSADVKLPGAGSLWLLVAGLGAVAVSLLFQA